MSQAPQGSSAIVRAVTGGFLVLFRLSQGVFCPVTPPFSPVTAPNRAVTAWAGRLNAVLSAGVRRYLGEQREMPAGRPRKRFRFPIAGTLHRSRRGRGGVFGPRGKAASPAWCLRVLPSHPRFPVPTTGQVLKGVLQGVVLFHRPLAVPFHRRFRGISRGSLVRLGFCRVYRFTVDKGQ